MATSSKASREAPNASAPPFVTGEEQWQFIREQANKKTDSFVNNYVVTYGTPVGVAMVGLSALAGYSYKVNKAAVNRQGMLLAFQALIGATALCGAGTFGILFGARKLSGVETWTEFSDLIRRRVNPISQTLKENMPKLPSKTTATPTFIPEANFLSTAATPAPAAATPASIPTNSAVGTNAPIMVDKDPTDALTGALESFWAELTVTDPKAVSSQDKKKKAAEKPHRPRLDEVSWGPLDPVRLKWRSFKENFRKPDTTSAPK